jgi:hypothetical protein
MGVWRVLERARLYWSPEQTALRRQHLREELAMTPMAMLREFSDTGGKVWPLQTTLRAAPEAATVPDWRGTALDGQPFSLADACRAHRAVLLTVGYSAFADNMIDGWTRPWTDTPGLRIVGIRPIEGCIKRVLLRRLAVAAARSRIPAAQHPWHMVAAGRADMRRALGIRNLLPAYVYLLDAAGLVRWKGAGPATEQELAVLRDGVARLAGP